MHLKTLTLKGFKSFASSTTLHLEPGVTCVVGPNGSGKSNVVDALAWVMGEQGAKNLRGGKMEDVVFAGTASRPALGRAEVVLTIDNTDQALPIDYTEVRISRTMFRNGGSDYTINGRACRLLDVQELLSDSGIGREMHVIVGQGQLDTILHASPTDRRGFVEEAAGVLKHRRRKERALRKIEAMQGNLDRLTDLTGEVRRQLNPLARQAKAAREAGLQQAIARDARLRLLADDVAQLQARATSGTDTAALVAAERAAAEALVVELRARLEADTAAAEAAAPRDARLEAWWTRLTAAHERSRSLGAVARERLHQAQSAERTGRGPDPERARADAAEATAANEAAQERLAAATAAADAATVQRDRCRADLDAAQRALQLAQREHAHRAATRAGLVAQHDTLVATAGAQRRVAASAQVGLDRAGAALVAARAARDAQASTTTAAGEDLSALDADFAAARVALAEAESELAAATERRNAADRRRASEAGRRAALVGAWEAQRRADRVAAGTVADLVSGDVAEGLRVQPGWEQAVAVALGDLTSGLLVADVAAARTLVSRVTGGGQGRNRGAGQSATVVLTAAPAGSPAAGAGRAGRDGDAQVEPLLDLAALVARGGVPAVAAADQVTHSDPVVQATCRTVLAQVVLVEDLEAALALQPSLAGAGATAVTRRGDVVGAGWLTVAGRRPDSALAVRAQVDAAERAVQEAEAAFAAADAAMVTAAAAVAAARGPVAALRDRRRAADSAAAAAASTASRLGADVRVAEADVRRQQQALDGALAAATSAEAAAASAATALAELDAQAPTAEPSPAQRDAAAAALQAAEQQRTTALLEARAAQERATAAASRAVALRRAVAAAELQQTEAERAERARRHRAAAAAEVVDRAAAVERRCAELLAQVTAEREALLAARRQREARITAGRAELDAAQVRVAKAADRAHAADVARTQVEAELAAHIARASQTFGVDAETLIEQYGPHLGVPQDPSPRRRAGARAGAASPSDEADVPADDEPARPVELHPYVRSEQEARAEKAERALSRLGRVNPLALEEFDAATERLQFLTAQLDDLRAARRELLDLVRDVDNRVEQVFTDAYADVAREFEHAFAKLFPGGEGRLVLTADDDMLTCGIDVEARPAGKRVKRLSLLSGGERSLVAIAFLVALFKARPSPFYVLDEVEAALDDTNLGRLLELYRELQATSQLIIVTHQKRTMEIADALYGVTMRNDGVTRVLRQELAGVDRAAPGGAEADRGSRRTTPTESEATAQAAAATPPGVERALTLTPITGVRATPTERRG